MTFRKTIRTISPSEINTPTQIGDWHEDGAITDIIGWIVVNGSDDDWYATTVSFKNPSISVGIQDNAIMMTVALQELTQSPTTIIVICEKEGIL